VSGLPFSVSDNRRRGTERLRQWDVTGELRRRIKKVFDQEGIDIPFPYVMVISGDRSGLGPHP
jgi:small-conductance mechanosensitive channel